MPRHVLFTVTGIVFFIAATVFVGTAARAETESEMLTEYFDLLVSGNIESASFLWADKCRERAARFNIEYADVPLKIDCTSPVVRDLEIMRSQARTPIKQVNTFSPDKYSKVEFAALYKNETVEFNYFTYCNGDYCVIVYPQDYYARNWPIRETKYFRLHVHPDMGKYLNPVVVAEADRFIESLGKSLGLSKTQIEYVAANKIEYYLCNSDTAVQQITGHLAKGMVDLASNDVISAFFPHYHEIVHLMVNYKLQSLPLNTMSIMREGLAVFYGGRWGKAPSTLMALGGMLYNEKIVEMDSILTVAGFEKNAGSDIAYPVAGLFTAYMLDLKGLDNYLKLYRELSGPFDRLDAMSPETVQQAVLTNTGKPSWPEFMTGFDAFLVKNLEDYAGIAPGWLTNGHKIYETENLTIVDDKDWIAIKYKSSDTLPPSGNVLFALDSTLINAASSLFDSQYRGAAAFGGHRYGVRFDRNEAGVYDYGTNLLLAKYIWGITPTDEYYNESDGTISIRFRKTLVDSHLPTIQDTRLLPD